MKILLIFLLSVAGLTVFAQQPQNLGGANTAVLVKGALVLGDTVSFAPSGSVSVKNGVLYIKGSSWRRGSDSVVDITTLGAVGDGTTDNTAVFNTAATLGRTIKIPAGNYNINGRINVSKSGASFIGDNKGTTKIVSSTSPIMFHVFGASNVAFENLSIYNNYPSIVSITSCILTRTDTVFDGVHFTPLDSNFSVRNCYFTAPMGDGVLVISNRGAGAFGAKRGIFVNGNTFENMGSGALTCLAGATYGMTDIHFEGNVVRHLGLRSDAPGFGISLSGNGITNAYIIENQAHDYKTVGYELAGPSYSLIQGNTGDSSHRNQGTIATCLFSMDATGSATAVGNKAIHNTSVDNTPGFPHFNNQDGVYLADNTLKADSIPVLFDSVRNVIISGDRYIRTGTNNRPVFYMRNGSTNAYINGAHFVGNSSLNQLVLFQNRTLHVRMENCYASGNTVDGTLVNVDTSCHDITGTFNSVLRGSFNFEYGLPTASSPQYDIVIDNDGIRKRYPHGGTWTHTGNVIAPAFPFTDTVVIGGTVQISPLTVYGKETTFFTNANPTPGLAQIVKNIIVQQAVAGGSGGTLTGQQINWRVNSGDSIQTALGYNVTFDNIGSIIGNIVNANGYSFVPGSLSNIAGINGLLLADGSGASFYNGIFSNITAGATKNFIFHNGTAASYFGGPVGIGEIVSANAILDAQSTTKGSLPCPRITNTQRDALTASEGLMIYSLTDHTYEFYNGTVWKQIATN